MITIYYIKDNKIVRNPDLLISEEISHDDIIWIDLFNPTIEEEKNVESFMQISLQTPQQKEEIESSSRYFETDDAIFCNVDYLINPSGEIRKETVSFVLTKGVLVSVRHYEFRSFIETDKKIQVDLEHFSTEYHLFINLLEMRIDADADAVEAVSKHIAELSSDIGSRKKVSQEEIQQINKLQETTMMIREVIFDRQRLMSGIMRSERFPNEIYSRLQLMIRDVNSIISHADFSFERLDFMRETALGLINLELSNTTKIFTMVSVFFMPATLIASIYGMNFTAMPELSWKFGYPLVIIFMALVSFGCYKYFKHKGWL